MAALGRQLLTGEGGRAAPLEGLALLQKAARTEGDAAALLAYAHALGVCMPRDLRRGADLLRHAASLGFAPAVEELQMLALPHPLPAKRALAETPRLRVFDSFCSAEECDWLIRLLGAQLQRAQIYDNAAQLAHSPTRTNSEANFLLGAMDMVVCRIRDRIAAASGIAPEYFEVAKVLHYTPGQAFTRHIDYFEPRTPALADEIARNGQRVATFLIYLNDDYEGGETEFLDVGVRYKGRKGDALMLANVDASGEPDRMSAHAGQPTTRGEKWVLSQWIRSSPINAFLTSDATKEPLGPEWALSV